MNLVNSRVVLWKNNFPGIQDVLKETVVFVVA
jgi:hypothetical protein